MGGSALQWRVELNDEIAPGSFYEINLSMRKIGPPDVTIGWELIVADPDSLAASAHAGGGC